MSNTPADLVSLVDKGPYGVLSLDSPERLNCLTEPMLTAVEEALRSFATWESHRVLVVTGSSGVFSVGADLATLAKLDVKNARAFSARGQALMSSVSRSDRVTIAAIDGYCLGGGLDLALSCDLRYASPRSSFQHPGVKRGIITGWGGNVRLSKLIGKDAARRYFLTGERIDAVEAERIGLINGIFDDPLMVACDRALAIADNWSAGDIAAAKTACHFE